MTKKSFCRKINLLSKQKSKKHVIEMFTAVLSEERAKASKKKKDLATSKKKRKAKPCVDSSSNSSSDKEEIHIMDQMEELKSQLAHAKQPKLDESTEEKAYNETLESLGEPRKDIGESHSN
jgi:flagellar hook-length control protein FliK